MSKGIQACDPLKTSHFVSETAPVHWLVWKWKECFCPHMSSLVIIPESPRMRSQNLTAVSGICDLTALVKYWLNHQMSLLKQLSRPLTITQTHLVITEPVSPVSDDWWKCDPTILYIKWWKLSPPLIIILVLFVLVIILGPVPEMSLFLIGTVHIYSLQHFHNECISIKIPFLSSFVIIQTYYWSLPMIITEPVL